MKICKVNKTWMNMSNFTNAIEKDGTITVFFMGEDYLTFRDEKEVKHVKDWLNEAHAKTELP